jgi:hypothetical protein
MNVFMQRTFWIRSAHIGVNQRETDLRNALQLDHRHPGADTHLQLRLQAVALWFCTESGMRQNVMAITS